MHQRLLRRQAMKTIHFVESPLEELEVAIKDQTEITAMCGLVKAPVHADDTMPYCMVCVALYNRLREEEAKAVKPSPFVEYWMRWNKP